MRLTKVLQNGIIMILLSCVGLVGKSQAAVIALDSGDRYTSAEWRSGANKSTGTKGFQEWEFSGSATTTSPNYVVSAGMFTLNNVNVVRYFPTIGSDFSSLGVGNTFSTYLATTSTGTGGFVFSNQNGNALSILSRSGVPNWQVAGNVGDINTNIPKTVALTNASVTYLSNATGVDSSGFSASKVRFDLTAANGLTYSSVQPVTQASTFIYVAYVGSAGTTTFDDPQITGVPEPTAVAMIGIGAVGLLVRRRRKCA